MKGLILETIVGSILHGTSVEDGLEDLDLMGVRIESAQEMLGFSHRDTVVQRTKPDGVRSEAGDVDRVVYGLRKYLTLALKGNPTVLLPLFAPAESIKYRNAVGEALRALAPMLVSKLCYKTYRGYVRKQYERLMGLRGQKNVTRPELVEAHGYDTKYAGHILCLGYQGQELLLTGRLTLPMPEFQRQHVLAVRKGEVSKAEIPMILMEAERLLDIAVEQSPLQEQPQREAVEQFMVKQYQTAFDHPKV